MGSPRSAGYWPATITAPGGGRHQPHPRPVKDTGVSARTLAETGLTASTAFSVKPEKVAAATLRAIARPKAEIVISVGPGRLLKALMDYFPGLGPAINRLSGADKLMASVADYREASRPPGPVARATTAWPGRSWPSRRQ